VLAEGGGAKIYKKAMLESFYVRRTKAEGKEAGFELHGFVADKVGIDVPPGGTLMIVDARGNQRGYGLRPAELTSSMMGEKEPFTIKVLNKEREIVLEKTLAFAPGQKNQGSRKFIEGTFSQRAVDDPRPDLPKFSIGGERDVERVLVKRDGKAFPIERYEQLLYPPRATAQVFKAGGMTFQVKSTNGEQVLDDPSYSWMKTAQITASDGHSVTLDWSLSQTRRAKWTADGFALFNVGSEKPFAVFNPFF
jgi:hypothetical protein